MPLSTSDSLRLTRTCTTVPSTSKVFPCRYLHFSFHPSTFLKHTTSSEHSTFRFYVAKLFLSTTRILSKISLSLSLLFLFSKVYPWPVLFPKNSIPNCSLSSFANYSILFLFFIFDLEHVPFRIHSGLSSCCYSYNGRWRGVTSSTLHFLCDGLSA